jgi:hypothetical protein
VWPRYKELYEGNNPELFSAKIKFGRLPKAKKRKVNLKPILG